jgi:hypothetical protein
VVSFTPQPLYPRGRAPGTHWIGGWVDPRTGLEELEKRKFLTLPGYRDSNSDPSVQPVASRYIDYATPAPLRSSTLGKGKMGEISAEVRQNSPVKRTITTRKHCGARSSAERKTVAVRLSQIIRITFKTTKS